MSLVEQFRKIENAWKSRTASISNEGIGNQHLFELAYHAANDNPDRCVDMKLLGGDSGGTAVLFNLPKKIFKRVKTSEVGVDVTVFQKGEDGLDDILNGIIDDLKKYKKAFVGKDEGTKDQIAKSILVQRKVDESMNRAMNKDTGRAVYFAIGECRERMALVPLLMEAEKSNIVQLALNKWMSAAANLPQEEPFPENILQGLLKNFLQLKSWMRGVTTRQLS
ncbi:MAG: putative selenocysteine system protein [Promethearchaeota archaeon]